MCCSSFRILKKTGVSHIFIAFIIKYANSEATEVTSSAQPFVTFNKSTNTYRKMEQMVETSYFRICGRELIRTLIKVCTPSNRTYPCFQSTTSVIYADRTSNRSYRRGVATVCCDDGKCSRQYLATFCCKRSTVAQQ